MKPKKQIKIEPKSTFLQYFPWDTLRDFTFLIALILLTLLTYFEINRIDSNINIVYEMAKGKQYSEEIDLVAVVNRTQEIAKEWFNYNISNVNISVNDISLDKFTEEGGVCRHYSHVFKSIFEKIGFNAKEISMPEMNHRVLMVWSNNSYCLIDQLSYICF